MDVQSCLEITSVTSHQMNKVRAATRSRHLGEERGRAGEAEGRGGEKGRLPLRTKEAGTERGRERASEVEREVETGREREVERGSEIGRAHV